MKKLLLAAVLALGATVVNAQSSVTIYGILDVGYTGVTTRSSTPSTGTIKSNINKFDQSGSTPSRLGFKGVEDLGGGTSALFTTEFQLYPEDATLSGNSTNGLVNRQTWVGLKQNGIGQATIGTQYTPIFTQGVRTDPGQFNDSVGSVIFPANNSSGVTTAAFTTRTSNSIVAQSDSFKGFRAGVNYANNSKDTTQTGPNNLAGTNGGDTNITGFALNADYTYDKLYATVVYQTFRNQNPTTVVSPVATPMTNNYGSNVGDVQKYAAVTYDFGILKAYAQFVDRKVTSTLNSGNFMSRQAQQIGVRGYVRPNIDAWASVGNGKYTAYGSDRPTANFVGWQAGSNYYLSKRSAVYAIVGSSQTSSTSAGSAGANQYTVGMRHSF
jgi:predicted porin